jgi:serine/threonine-protein kinase
VTDLAAGGLTTCVIVNGQAQCIGGNDFGQLGRGAVDVTAHPAFANVLLPPSASAISVGAAHACAVLGTAAGQKGPIACWGQNQNGQLGDGLDIDVGYADAVDPLKRVRATPVRVAAPK